MTVMLDWKVDHSRGSALVFVNVRQVGSNKNIKIGSIAEGKDHKFREVQHDAVVDKGSSFVDSFSPAEKEKVSQTHFSDAPMERNFVD